MGENKLKKKYNSGPLNPGKSINNTNNIKKIQIEIMNDLKKCLNNDLKNSLKTPLVVFS